MGSSFFTPLSWNDAGFILTGVLNTVYISLVAIVVGTLLGLAGSWFAVARHLNQIEPT